MNKKIIYFLILLSININIVNAESGNLLIETSTGNTYSPVGGAETGLANFETFIFRSDLYNVIEKITFDSGAGVYPFTYNKETNYSTFTISVGGSGGGYVFYNKNEHKITWIFYEGSTISGVPSPDNSYYFNLSYDNNFFNTDIDTTSSHQYTSCNIGSGQLSATQPLFIHAKFRNYASCERDGAYVYNVITKKRIVNNYNITYNGSIFIYEIDKSPADTLTTKIEITNLSHHDVYLKETTFNNDSFNGASIYNEGIKIFMNDSLGNYDFVIVNSSVTSEECNLYGDINTIKNNYNTSENVIINYNLTSCGYTSRLLIEDRNILNQKTWLQIPITDGTNKNFTWFIPENTPVGNLYLAIQYNAGGLFGYTSLNETNITISNPVSNVEFQSDNYYLGEALVINTYSYYSGYIQLIDSFGNMVMNKSVNANEYSKDFYFTTQNDNIGLYTVNLYNSTMIISSDTTYLSFKVVNQTVPSITPSATQIGLIDISNTLSIVVFGKIDSNDDSEISDDEIKTTGNKLFPTMLLLVIVILFMGAYNKLFRKK